MFVHPASGRIEYWNMSTISSEGMMRLLDEFATTMGVGAQKRIVIVMDGAGWHRSKKLKIPEGIHIVHQPPYAPELQPTECVWPLLREPLANRVFADLPELSQRIDARCNELAAQPETVRGRTHFHWWPSDLMPTDRAES